MKVKKNLGLYLHIPFCVKKCSYCDFYSFNPESEEFIENYVSAMMLQMEDISESCRSHTVNTVYLGGGTPSMLPASQLSRLLDSVKHNFKLEKNTEITMEVNPGTVNYKYLKAMRKAGINRLSIGMQSANDKELSTLGRIHTFAEFGETYKSARDAGFDNISIDIMYGLPSQTISSLRRTLEHVAELEPDHISLYCLKIEEGTPFFAMRDTLMLPDDDTEYDMYETAVEFLSRHGYERYEMSNFAKDGKYSRHNLKYWNCEEYIGIGAAAHSYFGGERYSVIRDASTYIDGLEVLEAGISIIDESRMIEKKESMNEYVMLRMRLDEGIDGALFRERYGVDFHKRFGQYLDEYIEGGFVKKTGENYSFTTKGMFVSNYILSAVLDFSPESLSSI
ncbi:MAG: radical SAM family heme chaperone HemW [Ruminococcaceae bacterium]|nr:radical SAM family heme chaperone HemW [Oscillospiraceae bacterium]